MLRLAIDAITSFSTTPLRMAAYLGLLSATAGFGLFVYALVSKFAFQTEIGWTSLMAAVSLLGGIQLLMLGVMGEYLGRLYVESKGRPLFILDQVVRKADAKP